MDYDNIPAKHQRGYSKYLRWLEFLFAKYLVTPSTLDETDEDFKRPT